MNRLARLVPRTPRATGVVTVVVLALVAALLFVPSGLALGKETYYAELARAGGLRSGDDVRIAGVTVGEVTDLQLRDARVRVSFRLSDSVDLRQGSRAEVKIATLLGTHILALVPGAGGPLPDRTIPLASTSVPFEVQDIIEAGGPALEELDGDKLRQALRALADGFRDTPELARTTLDNVARLAEVVVTRREQLDRLVTHAAAVTANLDANRDQLVDLLRQSSAIFAEITRRRDVIRELLADTRELARVLTGLVRDNEAKIAPLLRNVNVVVDTLQANEASLRQVAVLLGPASRYFANAGGNGPYLDVNGPNAIVPDSALCKAQGQC